MLRHWESIAGNLVLTTELKTTVKDKKLTFRALALHQSDFKGNMHADFGIIWYFFTTLCGWYRTLAPPSQPIERESEAGYRPAKSDLLFIEFPKGS